MINREYIKQAKVLGETEEIVGEDLAAFEKVVLNNNQVTIDRIMLDPFNPRFSVWNSQQQDLIQRRLMDDPKTKDLLYSMQTGLTWVNKIVVIRLSTYTDE